MVGRSRACDDGEDMSSQHPSAGPTAATATFGAPSTAGQSGGPAGGPPPPPYSWTPRKATRDTRSPVIGGVASGLALHLGLPVLWVRVGFVAGAVLGGGLGLVLYAALWLMLPADSGFETSTPGAESASRGGRRPQGLRGRLADAGPAVALAALSVGAVFVFEAVFGTGVLFWPIVLGVGGLALLWRQADEAQRERWLHETARLDPWQMLVGGGWAGWGRIVGGVVLLFCAALMLFLDNGALRAEGWGVLVAALMVVAAVALVVGPWLLRLATDLSAEREERIRTQERADMAAHLHDSVLQTLALIQKNSEDAATVARLARSQERDLRSWLYAGDSTSSETLAGSLRAVAAEVEDDHGISVDVVTVGDADTSQERVAVGTRPLVAATREALTNAAKHAGTGRVDVFAEIGPEVAEVFVRDRGSGFDLDGVPADRHGVRDSILARMERHGGSARIRSRPGEGTEVRLSLPLPDPATPGQTPPDQTPPQKETPA